MASLLSADARAQGSPPEGPEGGAEDPAVATARSALEASIKSKGKNSYYYAHANNLGKGADTKNYGTPPRLLSRSSSGAERTGRPLKLVTDYAWADSGKKVKVYITLPGLVELSSVNEDAVTLAHTKTSFELKITDLANMDYVLKVPLLNDEIQKATFRVKRSSTGEDKCIISLVKENDFTWYDLKKDAK